MPAPYNSPADAQQANHLMRAKKESERIVHLRSIIEAAARLIGRFGFQKTTVADIAREPHMSPSNIYRYFGQRKSPRLSARTSSPRSRSTRQKSLFLVV